MTKWDADDIPDLSNKVAIVTGANSGLGFEATKALAAKNCSVIMACRSIDRATTAREAIIDENPSATLEIIELDLSSKNSIETFVDQFKASHDRLDILLNNAGLMAIPKRETETGFEMQFGVNHIGHFILTGLLLDHLIATEDSRVTTVSSIYHERTTKIRYEYLKNPDPYKKWKSYATSKLANVLFAFELNRRLEDAGHSTISNAAHPGYADTNLQAKGPEMEGSRFSKFIMKIGNFLFAQSAAKGVLPELYAATSPDAQGGKYYGPQGLMNSRGYPGEQEATDYAKDEKMAKELWDYSEKETGIIYNFQN